MRGKDGMDGIGLNADYPHHVIDPLAYGQHSRKDKKMPRSRNPSMYPSFFHDVAQRAVVKPIRIPGGPGDDGKKKAEKYRFTYYGFREALKRYNLMEQYTIACGIGAFIEFEIDPQGEKNWYLEFRSRDDDPFWDEFKNAMAEMGEPAGAALPPPETPGGLESYQFQPIDMDNLQVEPGSQATPTPPRTVAPKPPTDAPKGMRYKR